MGTEERYSMCNMVNVFFFHHLPGISYLSAFLNHMIKGIHSTNAQHYAQYMA